MTAARTLSIDIETYSESDLTEVGAAVYAEHPSTEILCAAYQFSDEPEPRIWIAGDPCPDDVWEHIIDGEVCEAWNRTFEDTVMHQLSGDGRFPWPQIEHRNWRCTMIRARAMGFPSKLEHAAKALRVDAKKDEHGQRVMMQLMKPRPSGRGRYTPENAPEKFRTLYSYCLQDVRAERACGEKLLHLSERELELFHLDGEINRRGVYIDDQLVRAAQKVVSVTVDRLVEELRRITDGKVMGHSAVAQIKEFLKEGGIEVDSLDKEHVDKLLGRDSLTKVQRRVLEIRQEAGLSSVAKLDKMLACRNRDGRVRNTLQFLGASSTGRWSAALIQPQNLPRPAKGLDVPDAIEAILTGDADVVALDHGSPMIAVSGSLRGCITAAPGNELIATDLSQIESRLTAYMGNQMNVVDAFDAYDDGLGADIYKVTAAGIFDLTPDDIDDYKRQVGKVGNLSLGFGGGAGAFAGMARIYRVDVASIFDTIGPLSTADNIARAERAWKQRGRRTGLTERAFLAAELVKLAWRDDNAEIVKTWAAYESAALDAVDNPGEVFRAGLVRFKKHKNSPILQMRLPSGRSLWYSNPKVEWRKAPWAEEREDGEYSGDELVRSMSFWAAEPGRPMVKFWAYGGLFFQNGVQATARDIIADALPRLDAAGYPVVMLVHDEIVAEVAKGRADIEEFNDLVAQPVPYLPGLPIATGGFIAQRYRK